MAGVFVFSKSLRCQFADRDGADSIGIEDPRGLAPWTLTPNHSRADILEAYSKAERNGGVSFDTWYQHRDGFLFPVSVCLEHTGTQFRATSKMRGNGIFAEIAEGVETEARRADPESKLRLRYYAAVLRALSLGLGAASVLSPESAEIIFMARSLFSGDRA